MRSARAVSDASRGGIGFYCEAARVYCSEALPAAVTADENLADPLSRGVIAASYAVWRRVRYPPELLHSLLTSSEPWILLRGRPTRLAAGGGSGAGAPSTA